MSCLGKGVVTYLYEGVVTLLVTYNKDNFDVDIRNSLDDCFCWNKCCPEIRTMQQSVL